MFHVERLSDDVICRLRLYEQTLLKWQKAINLVSRGTLSDIWHRHIEDSIQILPFVDGERVLDIGSGAGFPGMVLAILGRRPDARLLNVTCVDSDNRKTLFLEEVARITQTKVTILCKRIEEVNEKFDVVTARGFAELKVLLRISKEHAKYGVFLKGANFQQEINEALKEFDFEFEIIPSKTDSMGRIIIVRNIRCL